MMMKAGWTTLTKSNIIHDDMKLLGYGCQYVNFDAGKAKFIKHDVTKLYKIEVDLFAGHCTKVEQPILENGSIAGKEIMYPFTDDERYLIFKLMDEYDKEKPNDEF